MSAIRIAHLREIPAAHHPAPRRRRRRGRRRSPPVRRSPGAHGPLRVRRHLRSGEPSGRCVRLSRRRARRAPPPRHDGHPLPRLQLRLGIRLARRHRSSDGAITALREGVEVDRAQHLRNRRVPGAVRADALDADDGDPSRHSRAGRCPGAHRLHERTGHDGRWRATRGQRPGGAVRRQALVPRQRDGRALADRPLLGRRVCAAGARDGGDPARGVARSRGRRMRTVRSADAEPPALDNHAARLLRRRPRLPERPPLRPQLQPARAGVPRVRGRRRSPDRGAGAPRGRGAGETRPCDPNPAVVRRVERLVQDRAAGGLAILPAAALRDGGAAADRGGVQPRGRAGLRRLPELLHPSCRRRPHREPGADGERDRAAAHAA